MKQHKIYLRKKNNVYTFETQIKGKNIYLIGLPKDYEKFLLELYRLINGLCPNCRKLATSTFFDVQKWQEINQKIKSADTKFDKPANQPQEVHSIKIMRTPDKDDNKTKIDDDDIKKLWEITKE